MLLEIGGAKKAYVETKMNLRTSELIAIELKQMKANTTPASVSEGREDQVGQSLLHELTMETKIKIDIVLNLGIKLKVSQRRLQVSRGERVMLEEEILRLETRRDTLKKRLQDYQRERSKCEAALNQREAVAEEVRSIECEADESAHQHCAPTGPLFGFR